MNANERTNETTVTKIVIIHARDFLGYDIIEIDNRIETVGALRNFDYANRDIFDDNAGAVENAMDRVLSFYKEMIETTFEDDGMDDADYISAMRRYTNAHNVRRNYRTPETYTCVKIDAPTPPANIDAEVIWNEIYSTFDVRFAGTGRVAFTNGNREECERFLEILNEIFAATGIADEKELIDGARIAYNERKEERNNLFDPDLPMPNENDEDDIFFLNDPRNIRREIGGREYIGQDYEGVTILFDNDDYSYFIPRPNPDDNEPYYAGDLPGARRFIETHIFGDEGEIIGVINPDDTLTMEEGWIDNRINEIRNIIGILLDHDVTCDVIRERIDATVGEEWTLRNSKFFGAPYSNDYTGYR